MCESCWVIQCIVLRQHCSAFWTDWRADLTSSNASHGTWWANLEQKNTQWGQGKREYWLLSMVRIRFWLSQRHISVLSGRVWQGIALCCKHHPSLDVTNGASQLMKDQCVLQFLLGKRKGTEKKRKRISVGLCGNGHTGAMRCIGWQNYLQDCPALRCWSWAALRLPLSVPTQKISHWHLGSQEKVSSHGAELRTRTLKELLPKDSTVETNACKTA